MRTRSTGRRFRGWMARAVAPTVLVAVVALLPVAASRAAVASRFVLALSTPPRLATIGDRDAYVVLQPWEAAQARRLKARDPHLEVLVYQELGSIDTGVGADGLTSSGVGYGAAVSHASWFLTRRDGARVGEQGYPYLLMADVGDRGYERRWTADVRRLLTRGPWDGVFMDDVNASLRPEAGSAAISGYPDDAAYERAMGAMLAYAGPRLRATGKLVVANIGEWVDHPAVARSWLRDLDGAMDEKFVKFAPAPGQGYRSVAQWLDQEREVTSTEALHKRFFAVTDAGAGDPSAQRYGWASLLLVADGRASYLAASSYTGAVAGNAAYDTTLGRPTGAMTVLSRGVWSRRFARGLVLVDPTSHPVRVSLGGAFSGSGLHDARTATLAAHSGLVLTRVAPGTLTRRRTRTLILVLVLAAILVAVGLLLRVRRRRRA